jgi:MFS family permease
VVSETNPVPGRWYSGITRYQWLVLVLASLGWVFDVFEGQVFVAGMNEATPALLPDGGEGGEKELYNNIILAAFLLGGATGGVLFGMVSDRIGRKPALTFTILFYSLFTSLSAFSDTWWQLAAFRFLVALGVGGEWAVASTLVAEVFPQRSRAWSQSIFHASSVLGTLLAVAAGSFIISRRDWHIVLPWGTAELAGWRLAFLLGAVPALLVIWVRASLRESERWLEARATDQAELSFSAQLAELFRGSVRRSTLVGVSLAAVALATFWGTHIHGREKMKEAVELAAPADQVEEDDAGVRIKHAEMLGMLLVTLGGGAGLLSFGPLAERLGRRGAFLVFLLGGLISSLILFPFPYPETVLYILLPAFGFLTLGMHAGCAVYFPELFPTRLRATGGGFCFNVGRVLAAPVLLVAGLMNRTWDLSHTDTAAILSALFLAGIVVLAFAPETRGRDLPE